MTANMNRFTPAAAAVYLDVSGAYLAGMRHHKTGPKFTKNGRNVFYTKAALDAWNTARLAKREARSKKLLTKITALEARVSKLRLQLQQPL